ncbi:hypothetical protein C5167_010548 [Papaver somniferum]|uniref:tRNA pseudouridine(55) synthase n=1 Tax=Papaver somniferum TaxID=3469 RepID=A0A4Y7K4L1_PAPSO|nr:hypothetical protein C5167_010548 [Papaver somniferum]
MAISNEKEEVISCSKVGVIVEAKEAQISTGPSEGEAADKIISDTVLSLPSHAILDLLSIGVCTRCIFRLFGVRGQIYWSSLLSPTIFAPLIQKSNGSDDEHSKGLESEFCSICLGILQFGFSKEKQNLVKSELINNVSEEIAKFIKQEGHEIDSFSLEVSIPPIILANERSVWLYLKKKYGSERWFEEKFHAEHVTVKDAFKLAITSSLETLLTAKSEISSSSRIRLNHTHSKASLNLEKESVENADGANVKRGAECSEQSNGKTDAAIQRSLSRLQDHAFCERFKSPPEKVNEPCKLEIICNRAPIYIGGRYLKYSRNVSQSRWLIDDERKGEASVEEIIGSNILPVCRGDNYKFHAAGREDIDVRMLGSGRPFLVEIQNARHVPSEVSIGEMEEKINNLREKLVRVRNLQVLGSEGWTLMREGETEKQKQYAALVWISRPLEDEDLQTIASLMDMSILQKTPVRVLHRRSPLDREKIIHWMKIERMVGSQQYFLLHLCTEAGTYIKEFVHGDLGRTYPNLGSILKCRAEILQLDVTDVKMDCFN